MRAFLSQESNKTIHGTSCGRTHAYVLYVDEYGQNTKSNHCLWLRSRYSQFSRNYFNCSQQFIRAKRNSMKIKLLSTHQKHGKANEQSVYEPISYNDKFEHRNLSGVKRTTEMFFGLIHKNSSNFCKEVLSVEMIQYFTKIAPIRNIFSLVALSITEFKRAEPQFTKYVDFFMRFT